VCSSWNLHQIATEHEITFKLEIGLDSTPHLL
jgi:hypothetical protein